MTAASAQPAEPAQPAEGAEGVDDALDALDVTLAALADPLRRRAVELLADRPHRAGELAAALGVTAPVMSRHLRVLRSAALVQEEHPAFDARVRIYSLCTPPVAELKAWLAAAEAGWAEQLAAFKDYVEGP